MSFRTGGPGSGNSGALLVTTSVPDYSLYSTSFWVYLEGLESRDLFVIEENFNQGDTLFINSADTTSLRLQCYDSSRTSHHTNSATGVIAADTWHHIVVVRSSASSCKVYVDDVEVIENTDAMGTRTAADTLGFGLASAWHVTTYDALIADIKFWDVALTSTEAAAEALAACPADYTDCIGFAPCRLYSPVDVNGKPDDLVGSLAFSSSGPEVFEDDPPDVPYWRGFGTAPDLGPFQAEEAAAGSVTGTAAFTIPIPTQAASGTATTAVTGTAAFTIPMPTQAASGTVTGVAVTGTAAFTAPMPTQAASGTAVTAITGTAAFTAPMPTQAASGTAEHTGTAAFTIPMPTMASSGTATTAVTGTAAFTAPMPTQAASGTSEHTGTAAFTIPLPTQAATGTATGEVTGTAAFTIPMPTQAAEGTIPVTGTAAFTIPLPTMASTGTSIGSVDTVSHRVVLEKDFTGLTISSSYTLTLPMGHTPVDATSGAVTITLPAAASGIRHTVKKIDSSANAVTIDGAGSETIDGATTKVLSSQYDSATVWSDQTEWWIE